MVAFIYYIKRLHSFSGSILYWNILAMSVISFFEGMSIFLLIPIINLSGIIDITGDDTNISKVFGFIDYLPDNFVLPIILGFFVLLVVGQNLVQQNLTIRNSKISQGFIGKMRVEMYSGLLQSEWSFFLKKRKSDLINTMTIELARVASGINQFLQLITSIVFAVIQIGFALWLSVKMTLLVLLSGIILAFFSRKFIKQSKKLGSKTSVLAQEYLAGVTDQLNGIKDIKSNALEESRLAWLSSVVQGMFQEQVEYIKLRMASQVFYKIASTILIAAFIFLSFNMFNAQPEQFLLIIIIFSRLWPRITAIQSSLEQLASTVPAFKSLMDLQNECKESIEWGVKTVNDKRSPFKVESDIKCVSVYFRYNKNEATFALQDINLTIKAKQMTAIVGHSGAGKSTLIDLLMGLNKPENGELLINGKPLSSENISSLRKSISYVSQDPFVFNASIRENLLMVVPNASENQLWDALEFAAAAEFVRKLPNGLDTFVGDRGVRLSGGERQRLVLARAILKKPSVLVLDEATSALDTENEAKIQTALERLKGTMTIIVIAHRLSTIRNADQVIVLDQGKIIQQGGFSQLAKEKRGLFSNLLGNQQQLAVRE
ncbi:ATP-binding cassette subfamily C protein [Bacillus fengqiuensis]|nr:ATP-binding cassette subfamily C protein [Bacillus fengqiuensis]